MASSYHGTLLTVPNALKEFWGFLNDHHESPLLLFFDRIEHVSIVTAEDMADRTFCNLYLNVDPVPAKGSYISSKLLWGSCGVPGSG
jgi:hypothetical protein